MATHSDSTAISSHSCISHNMTHCHGVSCVCVCLFCSIREHGFLMECLRLSLFCSNYSDFEVVSVHNVYTFCVHFKLLVCVHFSLCRVIHRKLA